MTRSRVLVWSLGLLFVVAATSSCSSAFGMPRGATDQGKDTFALWRIFFWAALVVATIVYGLIAWSILRYRRRRGDEEGALGAQFREHLGLEVVYTAIPIVMVIGLFALSYRTESKVTRVSSNPGLTVDVEAYSWGWRFSYPDQGVELVSPPSAEGVTGPQLVVPRGETIHIVLTSDDVIHAFWVPAFLFKRDAIPGRTTRFDVTPTELGTFHGACAEFCGLNHAYMTFSVRVVDPAAFRTWVEQRKGSS